MSTSTQTLSEFIESAVKSRKYPANTAAGRRSALNLFEAEFNETEKESIEEVKQNLNQIYNNVFNKNKSKMTAGTLETYKNRFKALLNDYEEYGTDPAKMASWNRPIREVSPKPREEKSNQSKESGPREPEDMADSASKELSRFEISLRPGVKAIVIVPSDIRTGEVDRIKKLADFLDSISVPE